MTQYEQASLLVSVLGFAGVAVTVWFLAKQTQFLAASLGDAPYATTSEQMFLLDQVFIEHPEIRPYFYEGKELRDDDPNRQRVLAVAETLLDFMGSVMDQSHRLKHTYPEEWWAHYFRDCFLQSPVLCDFFRRNRQWYPRALWEFMPASTEATE